MHNKQIGPTTDAMEKPIKRPRTKKLASISFSLVLFNAIKKVAKPSMRGLATGDICFFLLGSGRHAKRTKPPIGLVDLLTLYQYLQELMVSSHWYTPCYPFSSVLSNEMSY